MSRPFTAYLRVYEPVSAFTGGYGRRVAAAAEAAPLGITAAGSREREVWLRSQMAAPPRLLPAERRDGSEAPSGSTDVLVLRPEDAPRSDRRKARRELLVCPLEMRGRSAAALVSFLGESNPALQSEVLGYTGMTSARAQSRASAVLAEADDKALHVLSVTWTIPLPWFTLVEPSERRLVLGSGPDDPERELSWRVAMKDARRRVAEARQLAEDTIGEEGPTRILIDTDRWLARFHADSVVELDYGGLVQLLDDDALRSDTSAEQVHGVLDALRSADMEKLSELFESLREHWGELAARERFN